MSGYCQRGDLLAVLWKIEASRGTVEPASCLVVGGSSLVSGAEGTEPEAGPTVGLSDLRHPLSPRPLPHTSISAGSVLRSALPPHAPFPGSPHNPFSTRFPLLNIFTALLRLHFLIFALLDSLMSSVSFEEEEEEKEEEEEEEERVGGDDDDGGGK